MSDDESRCRRRAGRSRIMRRGTSASRRARTGGSRRSALNRPERKNPLTFDSYAELRDLFRELVYASDVRAVVLTGAGGNFCSGGDVFEIIEPLTRMAMPELHRLHPHDRRSRQGDAQLPAADRRRGRRHLRGRRRHSRDGLRPAARDAGGEDRVPVHARRPCRRRHGRLRNPAAHHRPGPRRRTAVHRPRDERRRKAPPGASTTRCMRAPSSSARRWRSPARSPTGPGSPMA